MVCLRLLPPLFEFQELYHEKIDSDIDEKELYEIDKLILDDSYKEWRHHVFESERESIYDMNISNDRNNI